MLNQRNYGIYEGRLAQDPVFFGMASGAESVILKVGCRRNYTSKGADEPESDFAEFRSYIPANNASHGVYGFLHTGDLVSLDRDGYIYIRGRKKNVIVLKNGKNVYPEELEDLIDALPYAAESMVYGQKKNKDGDSKDLVISAKIVYDPEAAGKLTGGKADAVDKDAFRELVQKDIDAINETLPTYKQIHRFDLTDEPMEKTTTGKIKRYAQK